MRLDLFLVENNTFKTRSKAQSAIRNKDVLVNGKIITKCGFEVIESDKIEVLNLNDKYVSRGGYKLAGALESFKIDLKDCTVLDIGASTGGFTDCALQYGAKKVYAYDVGTDQLDPSLLNDPRVIAKEKVNARYLTNKDFNESIDFICMDVSFISCTKMFEAIGSVLKPEGKAVILFKPQFEVGNAYLNNNGIVKSEKVTLEKMESAILSAKNYGLNFIDKIVSPIKGGDGNTEYLLYFIKEKEN